jgi:hypothetical protein
MKTEENIIQKLKELLKAHKSAKDKNDADQIARLEGAIIILCWALEIEKGSISEDTPAADARVREELSEFIIVEDEAPARREFDRVVFRESKNTIKIKEDRIIVMPDEE